MFHCETQEFVYAIKMEIFCIFMWNLGTGRDEMPDLCGCLFSYAVFVMVVTGQ